MPGSRETGQKNTYDSLKILGNIRHPIGCYKCALFSSVQYDGPSVKEKINSSLFSHPFIGEIK